MNEGKTYGTSQIQSTIDKGLRTAGSEQLATISKLSKLFQDNPAPTFVNAMLLRVAETFKDGNLEYRVAVARSLSQCGSHLTLAFSSAEIFRRILTVSHSNDPNAREAVLDVLAALCPIFPESQQSHHLIRESLSTTHEGEFRATCHALKSSASISSSFAESIVPQIEKLLEEDGLSESRKVLLCSTFSTMSATAQVVDRVFAIGETILHRSMSDQYYHAFLNSTTSLSIAIRYAIPNQIDTLLELLSPPDDEKRKPTSIRRHIILRELKRLAKFSNIWSEKQVKTFIESPRSNMTERALADFFDATTSLSMNCPHENVIILKQLVLASTGYGSFANPEVSVRFVYFASNVVCSMRVFENDSADFIESTMTALTIVVVNTCTCGKLKNGLASKLFRAIGDVLLAYPYSEHSFSSIILSAVFSGLKSASTNDCNQKERLELLCRLADTNKIYVMEIQKWACNVIREKRDLFISYPRQFSYLCLAVGTALPPDCPSVLYQNQPVLMYETARSALRNGHWKKAASPNLAAINLTKMAVSHRNWISALQEIADSQLLKLSLEQLEDQQNHLNSALSILKTGNSLSKLSKSLRFPIVMTNAMLSTSNAHFHLVSVLNPFTSYLSGALQPNSFFNPVVAKRFLNALAPCESSLNEALSEWSAVCRACFCADSTSFDLITLYYLRVSVLLIAVRVILKKQSPDTIIQIPPLSNERTCSQLQKEKLQWAIDKIRLLKYENVPNINTITALQKITEELAITPYMLPRFFFQQFYHVDVTISTTPQAENKKPVNVFGGETIPIRVDGSITSTHPSQIRSIIVYAEIMNLSNIAHNHVLKETVELNENNYFTAQFLLTFRSSCDVKFRIEFIDQTSRNHWKADGETILPIAVREIAPSHEMKRVSGPPPKHFMRGSVIHGDI